MKKHYKTHFGLPTKIKHSFLQLLNHRIRNVCSDSLAKKKKLFLSFPICWHDKMRSTENFLQKVCFPSDNSYSLGVVPWRAHQKRIPNFPIMALSSMAKATLPQNALMNSRKNSDIKQMVGISILRFSKF